ncbi:MAG: N-acetylmuramoyl-L-alanine amidase [Elusimicrobia bacterium]|nr:N-acetylmuramoyl-L-alanine amidase [Elusimicrobiota bacterium]
MTVASLLLAASLARAAAAGDPISVRYPEEGAALPALSSAWVNGSVSDPKAAFRVNGRPVQPYRTGGFLAYVPVSTGTFSLHCELDLPGGTASLIRTVKVGVGPEPPPVGAARIEAASGEPAADLEVHPGDWLQLQFRGTAGHRAEFQLGGQKKRHPMAEAAPGLYRAAMRVHADDVPSPSVARYFLSDAAGGHAASASAGQVAVAAGPPAIVAVKGEEPVNVRGGPGAGFMMFPPVGTRFVAGGRSGRQLRLDLSPNLEGWVEASQVEAMPAGTLPPAARLHTIRTAAGEDATSVFLGLTEKVPFIVEPGEDLGSLTVRLFYTTGDTDWVVYDSSAADIRGVRWRQEATQVVAVSVALAPGRRVWGYGATWDGGALKLELRHPPRLARQGPLLAGLRVVLDPGHSPGSPGAVGPTGVLESEVNFAIAKQVEKLLAAEGARPRLTRQQDGEATLAARARFARDERADLFVSIHNNNLNESADPFSSPHGYSVFYYQPQSLELAMSIHRAFQRSIGLADERLRYGNLFMARVAEMPAVLVENAYLTYPEQELLLTKPAFQRRLAGAIVEGVRDFLSAERARQAKAPRPQPAALARPEPELAPDREPAAPPPARAAVKRRPARQPARGKAKPGTAGSRTRPAGKGSGAGAPGKKPAPRGAVKPANGVPETEREWSELAEPESPSGASEPEPKTR